MENSSSYLAIILAAGKGTRLDTNIPKPLYKINNLPIIDHLINTFSFFSNIDVLTVVGHQKNKLIEHIQSKSFHVVQDLQNGTGEAVKVCLDFIVRYEHIFIFMGDAPFIGKNNVKQMMSSHMSVNADCSFLYSTFPFDLADFKEDGGITSI